MLVQDSVSTDKPKILVVLHQEHSTPGRVGRILQSMGYELDIRRPRFGCPLPKTMDDHAAAVIFGGPMSANDEDDFVKQEIDWIATPLKANKPYLGICLGGQMMARHLGARVYRHPEKGSRLAIIRSSQPNMAKKSAMRLSPAMSINGIQRALTCPPALFFWPRASIFPCKRCAMALQPMAFNFTPMSLMR